VYRALVNRMALCVVATLACQRERRGQPVDVNSASPTWSAQTTLAPGQSMIARAPKDPYRGNAYAMSEGKRLYNWFNCVGCHAHGGGGMGPPLMDERWIYGSEAENIYSTIVEGRPNGMPSFRGKIPDQQLWQLAAYVRSMAGLAPVSAAPGRDDAMNVRRSENRTATQTPIREGVEHP
jgi:cytochrome c oxidase cbb3-type subunit 3